MAITRPIAGAYTSTWNAGALSYTKDGFTLRQDMKAEMLDETDAYGNSIIDFVYRGGNVYLITEVKVYSNNAIASFWPAAAIGVMAAAAQPIGRLASTLAKALVLTSTAATPAVATPATLTVALAVLPPDSNLELLYTSRVRAVPLRWLAIPEETGGTVTWFTMT